MDKLGQWTLPQDMADGSGKGLQYLRSGLAFVPSGGSMNEMRNGDADGSGIMLQSLDAPLVRWGAPLPFPTPLRGNISTSGGPSFVLFDNVWNTNFLFWWPFEGADESQDGGMHADVQYRLALHLPLGA